jgi:multisubunit Na+/H+ antiporter MnhC subunit
VLGGAVNLAVFLAGRPGSLTPPIIPWGLDRLPAGAADPLPQALVLTAIVIGFAMTAFVIMLALKARAEMGTDHVDGEAP